MKQRNGLCTNVNLKHFVLFETLKSSERSVVLECVGSEVGGLVCTESRRESIEEEEREGGRERER